EHEHAVAGRGDRLDLARAICRRSAIAGEIEQRRLAATRRQIPGDELHAAPTLENDLLNIGQSDVARRVALLVGQIEEVAVQHPGADADERVGAEEREKKIEHDAIKAFPSIHTRDALSLWFPR